MSCNKCDCCIERIKVTEVTTDVASITLHETTVVLSTLPVGKKIEIDVDPELLPESTLPVVLTDGTTTIPLTMEDGGVFRENLFLPFCRKLARCWQYARVLGQYKEDETRIIVFKPRRPRRY